MAKSSKTTGWMYSEMNKYMMLVQVRQYTAEDGMPKVETAIKATVINDEGKCFIAYVHEPTGVQSLGKYYLLGEAKRVIERYFDIKVKGRVGLRKSLVKGVTKG